MSQWGFSKNQKWIIILLFFDLWWPFFKHRCPVMLFWRIWGYFLPKISGRGGVVFLKKNQKSIFWPPLELFLKKWPQILFYDFTGHLLLKNGYHKSINKKVMVVFWFFKKMINVTPLEFFGKKLLQILQKDPTGYLRLKNDPLSRNISIISSNCWRWARSFNVDYLNFTSKSATPLLGGVALGGCGT